MKKFSKWLRRLANHPRRIAWLFISNIGIASVVFSLLENRSIDEAIWWASVTATTVGYGDIFPAGNDGRLVGLWLMYTSVFFFLPLVVGHIVMGMFEDRNVFTHEEQEALKEALATAIKETRALTEKSQGTQAAIEAAVARLEVIYQEVDTLEEQQTAESGREAAMLTLLGEVRAQLAALQSAPSSA